MAGRCLVHGATLPAARPTLRAQTARGSSRADLPPAAPSYRPLTPRLESPRRPKSPARHHLRPGDLPPSPNAARFVIAEPETHEIAAPALPSAFAARLVGAGEGAPAAAAAGPTQGKSAWLRVGQSNAMRDMVRKQVRLNSPAKMSPGRYV